MHPYYSLYTAIHGDLWSKHAKSVNLYSGGHAPIIWGAHHYLSNIFISKPSYNLLTMYYSLIHYIFRPILGFMAVCRQI